MRNKSQVLLAFASLSVLSICLSQQAFAADVNAILPSNDSSNCSSLIQQGDADVVMPTTDLHGLQICMNSCDVLYRTLGDQKRYSDMLRGSAYCRKSLNNLYFASIAQAINDDLDMKTQQQSSYTNSILNHLKATQNPNSQQQSTVNTGAASTESTDTHESTTPPPANNNTPSPANDGINWF